MRATLSKVTLAQITPLNALECDAGASGTAAPVRETGLQPAHQHLKNTSAYLTGSWTLGVVQTPSEKKNCSSSYI